MGGGGAHSYMTRVTVIQKPRRSVIYVHTYSAYILLGGGGGGNNKVIGSILNILHFEGSTLCAKGHPPI